MITLYGMGSPNVVKVFIGLEELALAGGALREIGEVGLPMRVRRTRLYRSLVDSTLRFLIEQVGGVGSRHDQRVPGRRR